MWSKKLESRIVNLKCLLRDLSQIKSCSSSQIISVVWTSICFFSLLSPLSQVFFFPISFIFLSFFSSSCLSILLFFSVLLIQTQAHPLLGLLHSQDREAWPVYIHNLFLLLLYPHPPPSKVVLYSPYSDSKEIDRRRARIKHSEGGDIPPKYFVVTNNQLLRVKYLLVYSQKQAKR